MNQDTENSRVSAIRDICGAVDEVREFVKNRVSKYKCHVISQDELKQLYGICGQIREMAEPLGLTDTAFRLWYEKLESLVLNFDMCRVSSFLEDEFLQLVDNCIQRWGADYLQTDRDGKRAIKIKYVDFYGGFEPEGHWLYKALIRRYKVVFSDTPDYLFFSCFGSSYLQYNCVRIFVSNEAVYPNLNLYDYAITYSDFKISDRLLPNRDAFEDLAYRQLAEDPEDAGKLLDSKSEFCNFVYSNKNGEPFREELFWALNKYRKVLSGGKFLNNIGGAVDDLREFQSRFKFSIACENSWYRGYTTEKLINALNAGTIPIYWGNSDISDIVNSAAIINCHDYPDMDSIVEEVKRLDQDDTAYKRKLMEPILTDSHMVEKYLREREEFIYHIIDQPYAQAFRRNRGLRGQWYNDWFCYTLGYPNEWFTPEKGQFVEKEIEMAVDGPLVSILIPVYNRRELVKQAINSALAQAYQNIEIIVVDNCSTDDTYEELQACYGNHSSIKLYRNDHNIGPVNNWKACLDKAKGEYVKILWSDDITGPKFIGSAVKIMEQDPTVGMVYSECIVFQGDDFREGIRRGRTFYHLQEGTGRYPKDVFYKGMFQEEASLPVSPGCALLRREDVIIWENIPNRMDINCNINGAGIDLLILLQALEKYEHFYFIDQPMNFFRWHEGSFTAANNLVREYNLAKLFFCIHFEGGNPYLRIMQMRILRDERVTDAQEGVDILCKYGMSEVWK